MCGVAIRNTKICSEVRSYDKQRRKTLFFEKLYDGEEIIFTALGKKYFVQGYYQDDAYYMELQEWFPEEKMIWQTAKKHMYDCAEEFLDIPLFDGKSFWQIENELEWVDE